MRREVDLDNTPTIGALKARTARLESLSDGIDGRLDDAAQIALAATALANTAAANANGAADAAETATQNAQGVVDSAPALLQARDQAQAAEQGAEAAAASVTAISVSYTIGQSQTFAWGVYFSDGFVPLGIDAADGFVVAPDIRGVRARYSGYEVGGATLTGGTSSNYLAIFARYAGGEVAFGLTLDEKLDVAGTIIDPANLGGGSGSGSALSAPTWIADYASVDGMIDLGQSQCAARKSEKPAGVLAAASLPVAPGHWYMFGGQGPRIFGEGTEAFRSVLAPVQRFTTLSDLKEADTGQDAVTSAWGAAKVLADAGLMADRAVIVANTSIGGQTIDEIRGGNGSRMPDNRRRAIRFMSDQARAKYAFQRRLWLRYWQVSASRTLSRQQMYDQLNWLFDEFGEESRAQGWEEAIFTVVASAAAYQGNTKSSGAPLAFLDIALARSDVIYCGADWIAEPAVGALAVDSGDDPLHLSGLGETRIGYQKGAAERLYLTNGARIRAAYVADGTATLSNAGTRVTLPFIRPAGVAGTMRHTGGPVLDPAASGGAQAADPKRPFGVAVGATGGDGSMLHPSVTPVPGSFAWTGDTLGFDLTGDIRSGSGATWVNHANYFDDPVLQSGPTRGARSTLYLDTGETASMGGEIIRLDPLAAPQRIPLTIV